MFGEVAGQRQEIPMLTLQEAGWASGPVWKGAENLIVNGTHIYIYIYIAYYLS